MNYRYYIIDSLSHSVARTNNKDTAERFAKDSSGDYLVIDKKLDRILYPLDTFTKAEPSQNNDE